MTSNRSHKRTIFPAKCNRINPAKRLNDFRSEAIAIQLTLLHGEVTSTGVMKCPVSLQGVAAEAAAWGASRAARCSWPSRSSTGSWPSWSSSWPCWRRSVSINLPQFCSEEVCKAAEIPAVTCATSPAPLWSQWLNSCSQHSSDLLANSTGSRWHWDWEARRGGGAGRLHSPTKFSLMRIKRICSRTFFTWQLPGTNRCFSHQRDVLLGLNVVNLHPLQPSWGFQGREPVSERELRPRGATKNNKLEKRKKQKQQHGSVQPHTNIYFIWGGIYCLWVSMHTVNAWEYTGIWTR